MSKETFIAYWSGQEPTGVDHCPTLAEMPDTIDVVILFPTGIDASGNLDFGLLVNTNTQATIMGWMAEVRGRQKHQARQTKFLLSIASDVIHQQDPGIFAKKVADAAQSWGVDGIDIDFEPPVSSPPIIPVVKAIKSALPAGSIMSAPIYFPWVDDGT